MRPSNPKGEIRIPPPSGFVQRVPLFPTTDAVAENRRFERKRLVLWFGIAVALHAVLLFGIWLMPPLRIKWEPSPDAWVQVTSLPLEPPAAQAPAVAAPPLATPAAAATPSAPQPKNAARDPGISVSLLP